MTEFRKHAKRRAVFLLSILLCLLFSAGCGKISKNIVILYTNDVHCGIEEGIGFGALAAYKKNIEVKTPYVTLVDCGDAIQGDAIGGVSRGDSAIECMNAVGYDFAILGNHEFDYGMERLGELIRKSDAEYLGCNIVYTGTESNPIEVKPYVIQKYGRVKVGFVGVSTPDSITSSTPTYFMDEEGKFIYNFCNDSSEHFYTCVQEAIDQCVKEGADYVIVLSHLGDNALFSPYSSVELIQNTTGIDAVLDGHAHNVIPCHIEKNKTGEEVLLSSTGTKMENIGQLVITPDGSICTGLISYYDNQDEEVTDKIAAVEAEYEDMLNQKVAFGDRELSCYYDENIRLVRNRETTIGDFCADAYRCIAEADIALVNGGGIRESLPKGDISYADIIAVHPFGNTLCMVEASGWEILDALELSCMDTQSEIGEAGEAIGESGGFLQVSGLKFTVNTDIPSSVELDENGLFVQVGGERRIGDVLVQTEDGSYEPIIGDQIYKVASHNYIMKEMGSGYSMFADNKFLIDSGMADYQILITYLTEELDGKLDAYAATDGRITVK